MPLASYGTLYSSLLNSVVEVKFTRRRQLPGLPPIRRMLCTNNMNVLGSTNGRIVLNYRTPTNRVKYDPSAKNLVITWDILMQDFRTISLDACEIAKTYAPDDEFWTVFNETYFPMSQQQKIAFMMS
jgi:hypothetical protein